MLINILKFLTEKGKIRVFKEVANLCGVQHFIGKTKHQYSTPGEKPIEENPIKTEVKQEEVECVRYT